MGGRRRSAAVLLLELVQGHEASGGKLRGVAAGGEGIFDQVLVNKRRGRRGRCCSRWRSHPQTLDRAGGRGEVSEHLASGAKSCDDETSGRCPTSG